MKFLILGCNGMAGHTISLYLKERGHRVTGFARSRSEFIETVIGDAFDQDLLKRVVAAGDFETVVNCIGILNQTAESHKAEAVYLNAYLPHYLETVTAGTSIQVVHMSTDCVFSGKKGQYAEDDLRDGELFYDRSKALGELENQKDFTLRTSIIGPDLNPQGIGLLNWFLQQEGSVKGYSRVIWTGMTTLQLAKCIEVIASKRLYGLYHAVPEQVISKHNLLVLCNQYLREKKLAIYAQEVPAVDKSLVRSKVGFDYKVPGYEQMIAELGLWISRRKHLYPHYK